MNHDEDLNDSALARQLRGSLAELAMPDRPPLDAITSRGRAHQRRRLSGFAGLGAAGAAAGAALAVGLTGTLGAPAAAPTAQGTAGSSFSASPARSTPISGGTVRTDAFTLSSNANGTDTLTLTHSQMLDPAALQRALTEHGIPALVKSDTYCSSTPAAPDPRSIGVLSVQLPVKPSQAQGLRPFTGGQEAGQLIDHTSTVINPAAMPAGTELFFGYSNSDHVLYFSLIYTRSYTCTTGQQPPANQ